MKNIAILASGSGTNAENIIKYFNSGEIAKVRIVLSNKKDAYVLERAKNHNIHSEIFTFSEFCGKEINPTKFLNIMKQYEIDYIILAGFLLKVPEYLLNEFPNKIINIHPALLPNFGGKGMHGIHVHEAVIAAGEKESGITIHLVDAEYDKGRTLAQYRCSIEIDDTADDLAAKIHELEQTYFPAVIEKFIIENCASAINHEKC